MGKRLENCISRIFSPSPGDGESNEEKSISHDSDNNVEDRQQNHVNENEPEDKNAAREADGAAVNSDKQDDKQPRQEAKLYFE